jgi:hypothetical protein
MLGIRPENFEGLLGTSPDVVHLGNWPVADRYEIASGRIYAVEGGEFPCRKHRGLEDPGLFISLARLGARGEPSDKSILGWVRENGLLRAREDGYHRPAAITLESFRTEVLSAHQLLSLYAYTRTGNIAALRDMLVKAKRHPSSEWPNTSLTTAEKYLAWVREEEAEAKAALHSSSTIDGRTDEEVRVDARIRAELFMDPFSVFTQMLPDYLPGQAELHDELKRSMEKTPGRTWKEVLIEKLGREGIEELRWSWEEWMTEKIIRHRDRKNKALLNNWAIGHYDDQDIVSLAWYTLEKVLGQYTSSVRLGFGSSRIGQPERRYRTDYIPLRSWECPDLLSAMYLQFYLFVTSDKPTRNCENPSCGMPFLVTRKDKRFCNATCRSSARYYQRREQQPADQPDT